MIFAVSELRGLHPQRISFRDQYADFRCRFQIKKILASKGQESYGNTVRDSTG